MNARGKHYHPVKPARSYSEQFSRLTDVHGLIIDDEARARYILSTVNYYRLTTYGKHLRRADNPDLFLPGVSLETLYSLYQFDMNLRHLLLPVLEIYGTSMKPNLAEGDIVVSVKSPSLETGDVIAFYYNNRVLVKRVIATGGESVYIDAAGNVSVNGTLLDEPYLAEKDAGTSDLDYPYVVPAGTYFVLGDHRESSVDSRNSLVGCVEQSEIVGKIIFRVWPLSSFGKIK